jgi:hypothetical protein
MASILQTHPVTRYEAGADFFHGLLGVKPEEIEEF